MATPYTHGIQTGSILPLIYNTPELNEIRLTPHNYVVDYYRWIGIFCMERYDRDEISF